MKSQLFLIMALTGCATELDTSDTEQASSASELNHFTHHLAPSHFAGGGGAGGSLSYHGGPVITDARVVTIFWGSAWQNTPSEAARANAINGFVSAFGASGEYNTITQYSKIGKPTANLLEATWTDVVDPPQNATDAAIQAEVLNYLASTRAAFDPNAIYEVFLPATSYSSDGASTSCGGPKLAYCAYHGNFASGANDVRYASMPYPSCGGCSTTGFSDTQNFEHFISHETREAVTDPDGTGWFDRRGYEADDKCAWAPTPFTDSVLGTNSDGGGAYAFQYEWSNANSGCVKTR